MKNILPIIMWIVIYGAAAVAVAQIFETDENFCSAEKQAAEKPRLPVTNLFKMLSTWTRKLRSARDLPEEDFRRTFLWAEESTWNETISQQLKFIEPFFQNFIHGDLSRVSEETTRALKKALDKNDGKELENQLMKLQVLEHVKLACVLVAQFGDEEKFLRGYLMGKYSIGDEGSDIGSEVTRSHLVNVLSTSLKMDPAMSTIIRNTSHNFLERLSHIKSKVTAKRQNLLNNKSSKSELADLEKFQNHVNAVEIQVEKERAILAVDGASILTAIKIYQQIEESEDNLGKIILQKSEIRDNDPLSDFGPHVLTILWMPDPIFDLYKETLDAVQNRLLVDKLAVLPEKNRELKRRTMAMLSCFKEVFVSMNDLILPLKKIHQGEGRENAPCFPVPLLKFQKGLDDITLFLEKGLQSFLNRLLDRDLEDPDLEDLILKFSKINTMVSSMIRHVTYLLQNQGYRKINKMATGKAATLRSKYEEILNATKLWTFPISTEFFSPISEVLYKIPVPKQQTESSEDVEALLQTFHQNVDKIYGRLNRIDRSKKETLEPFCRVYCGDEAPPFASVTQTPESQFLRPLFEGRSIYINFLMSSYHRGKDAIKFWKIGLDFSIGDDPTMNTKLKASMASKTFWLMHGGTSSYRYRGKVYELEFEPTEFMVSMEENPRTNLPMTYNPKYRAATNRALPLSPFALWTIRISPYEVRSKVVDWVGDFGDLKTANITLKLVGDGVYIPMQKDF